MMRVLARLTTLPPRPRHLLYPIAYMGLIYILSSIPGAPIASDDPAAPAFEWLPPAIQNVLHVPLYAGLAFLWCWALRSCPIPTRALGAFALLLTAGYGFADEWHQSFVPGRYPSATDVVANALGALVGVWFFFHRQASNR